MAHTIAALFGGQGSQYPGMGKDLYDNFAQVREIYACANDILGFDVAAASFSGDERELSRTAVAQPAIFAHALAAFAAAGESLPAPAAVAGHSLGEYAALCCAGAYGMEDGFRIIAARASAMEEAARTIGGAMIAVTGVSAQAAMRACGQVGGEVWPVNFNQPEQTVLSGEEKACTAAAELLAGDGARTIRLSVSAAFHTPLMVPAARRLREALGGVAFRPCRIPFYSNLSGDRLAIEDYPDYFAQHMVSPVRFVEQVAAMARDGIDVVVEYGPKRTAASLAKKNCRALITANVEDAASLDKAVRALGGRPRE